VYVYLNINYFNVPASNNDINAVLALYIIINYYNAVMTQGKSPKTGTCSGPDRETGTQQLQSRIN
jgi:hypothetical protein